MAQAWPAIPAPVNQLDIQNQPLAAQSDPEQLGLIVTRRRAARGTILLNLAFVFTAAEKLIYETFFSTTLNNGNKWLSATWLTDAGYADYVAKIIEPAESNMIVPNLWNIGLKVELKYMGKNVNGYIHPLYKETV